jgi:signal transduction histidine kinase
VFTESKVSMKRHAPYVLIGLLFCAMQTFGWMAPIDNALQDLRNKVEGRPATGEVILVDIDTRSLRAIDVWPWPRSIHGALVDRLVADGAARIAFDIDFSSRSTEIEDRAFADALARSDGRVVLAALQQVTRAQDGTESLVFNAPIDMLREHVTLGLVNVFPGTDTFIRRYRAGAQIGGHFVPSLPFALARQDGTGPAEITIDYGIRPDTVPRVSLVDVLAGNVPSGTFKGKAVVVGATALELGDQFAAPVYGVIDGPMLQAMAFETMAQDRSLTNVGTLPAILGIIALIVAWAFITGRSWLARTTAVLAFIAVGQAVGFIALQTGAFAFETAGGTGAILCCFAFDLFKDIERQAVIIFQQRLVMGRRGRMLDRVISDSFDGVIITDTEGQIEVFNVAAETISGLRRRDAKTLHIDEIIRGASQPVRESVDAGDETPGPLLVAPLELELIRVDADKTRVPVEISVSRSTVPEAASRRKRTTRERPIYTYTFRDITNRKRAQADLISAKESAESANRAKTEFLANMSHELRTPLNAVIGFSELMKDESFGPMENEDYLEYSGVIHDSGNHLLSVINDILDISRIETGSFELNEEPFDFADALGASVRIAQGWQQKQPRRLSVEMPEDLPWLVGDQRLVRQVALNLLSNSYKFTEDDTGTVSLRGFTRDDGALVIEVSDNGIGIPEEAIPRLTEAFYQVDGTLARNHDGTGLGLSLVKTFVDAHDGELEISSVVGTGTKIQVAFPKTRVCAPAEIDSTGHEAVVFAS